ncbi:hypothetical protein JCM8202_000990 [Rhodotorula sphaerocarpa]
MAGDLGFPPRGAQLLCLQVVEHDRRWHLRRERFVAYQAAMLICLAAECTATYSLSKYEDLQDHVEKRFAPAHLYNNGIIDMEISTIVLAVSVACLFGADFFFLLQFPRRRYPLWYQRTKEVFAVAITSGIFACALGSTIIVARNSAVIEHVPQQVAEAAATYYFRPPLRYRDWAVNIAFVCLLWLGWIACVVSTILMFRAADWDHLHGIEPRRSGSHAFDSPRHIHTDPGRKQMVKEQELPAST